MSTKASKPKVHYSSDIMTRGIVGHGPANIMKHLGGLNLPASKQDIIDNTRKGEGPDTDEVLKILNKIDDKHTIQ